MSEKELDSRIHALPPCFGVHHFKKGWMYSWKGALTSRHLL
ncbi:hypothetical protein AZE42_12736 [Rhizopogon vesiculosus]|uniref:Uncharacterized protein n=1 Tax=Rhizopogon vesiculosus TaxID=180088 RepID=A0A1J8Q760_9AGAM|nr:hypothetical protein AZE42_12736 [Rhizopogon vesiculosus]